MCYVQSGKDLRSSSDLQVLVADTVYNQGGSFTFGKVKNEIMRIIHDSEYRTNTQELATEVDKVLFSTLQTLMQKQLVIYISNNHLQYIE